MKKKSLLMIILCFYGGFTFAQHQAPFYYYKGEQITLPINTQHFLVYADLTKISVDFFEKEYQVTEWIEDGHNGVIEAQVSIPNGNYDSVVNVLKAKEYVIDIEPVIGNNVLYNTSRLFYVKLHTPQDYSLLSSIASRSGAEIRGEVSFCENWYELSVDKNSTGNSIETANQFWESQYFADIDPGFIFHFEPMSNTSCVSDSRFDEQWGMQAIKACSAWKITKGDTNVRIAVIDMGIDVRHQEFDSTHVVFSYDIETNTPLAKSYFTEDWPRDNNPNDSATRHYHGMHVGGIIFANHNRYEVAGCCPNSSLVNISTKFIDDDSIASKMANSINLAVLQGAKVINNSWGDAGGLINRLHSPLVENAIDYAIDQNRIVVFSAGNEGDSVNYPARYRPDILTVGAIDSNLFVASFSNIGPELDVVAPGVSILSTYNPNTYHSTKGTSMAAPHVSGVMGLLFSINPNLTTAEAREIVELTAQKIGIEPSINDSIHNNGLWDYFVGYGLVDAHRAVLKAAYHKVYGDTALTFCDTSRNPYTVRAPHNANIDSVSFFWTCSDNLQMVAGQNTDSVWVKFVSSGKGQLRCYIIHDGDTVVSSLEISNMSGRTIYDNMSINSSITYPDTFVLSREVVVDSLSMLTWQDKTVLCTPDCRLIVRPGGKLIVDGGTLTSACAGEMWQGIEVVGDRSKSQTAANQGVVELKNGAVIENAWCGIRTGLRGDTLTFATTGGIIAAENATFRNNRQSVVINSYAYTPSSGSVANNECAFENCTFVVDTGNLFAANNTAFAEHVRLWDVKGVEFLGCDFRNNAASPLSNGRGIYAHNAGLVLDVKCGKGAIAMPGYCGCPPAFSDSCSFSGFTTAVEVLTDGNPYAVEADRVKFSNNTVGILVNANNYVTVTRCDFNLQTAPYSLNNTGLRLDNCTGYKVEGNCFVKTTYTPYQFTSTGIYVNNSGNSANLLHLNSFSNLNHGIRAEGTNGGTRNGLQFTCNDFSWCGIDFYVGVNATVAKYISSGSAGADNVFQNTRTSSLYNAGSQQICYYFSPGANHAPSNVYNITVITTNTANSCASTLCNGGGNPKLLLAGFQSGMDDYATALAQAGNVDGTGNADDGTVETQNFASLQQGGSATLSETAQTLSDTYYAAVRTLMSDSLLDLATLEQWHSAAQPIADPYSLTETRFCEGYAETFAADADDAEMANYAEFHAMKVALRDNGNSVGANNYSPLQSDGHVNWYALTSGQIAQLQTIAERNTGRASVMAKGVLCFFFGICYEDEDYADPSAETRAKRTAMGNEGVFDTPLRVWPNPTDDLLHIELSGTEIATVALYDLQGRMVTGVFDTPLRTGATATVNMRDVPAGVYLLRVTAADGHEHHRKIVKR